MHDKELFRSPNEHCDQLVDIPHAKSFVCFLLVNVLIPILSSLLSACFEEHCVAHHQQNWNLNVNQEWVHAVLHFHFAFKLAVKRRYPNTKVEEGSPEQIFEKALFYWNARKGLTVLVTHVREIRQGIWRWDSICCQQRVIVYDYCCICIPVQDHVYLTGPIRILLVVYVYLRSWSISTGLLLQFHWSKSPSWYHWPIQKSSSVLNMWCKRVASSLLPNLFGGDINLTWSLWCSWVFLVSKIHIIICQNYLI